MSPAASNPEQEPTYANLPADAAGQGPRVTEDLAHSADEQVATDDPAQVGVADNTDE